MTELQERFRKIKI
jgi:hypothetical protein